MNATIRPRKLWYEDELKHVPVDQDFLLRETASIVLLGEAGMGKSTLLEQLGRLDGYAFCTARRLINALDPRALLGDASTLVVDALDEVPAQKDGDAVDLVVRKLEALGSPRFVLSCRVADWQSAIAREGFVGLYSKAPTELHLFPLDRDDAAAILTAALGEEMAEQTLEHLEKSGLSGLWSNPQTLELVERVAKEGKLPKSKGQLFEDATALLAREHRETKGTTGLATMPEAAILDAAGAGFAALILTGKEALCRLVNVDHDDLALREIGALPAGGDLGTVLGARLFSARGAGRFTYVHRAVGEFLGARWLAQQADSERKRRRLLDLFGGHGLVPASLRGLHSWLAWHSPALGPKVIQADPMGVIEYGDADRLNVSEGRALFAALDALSRENPRFRGWSDYRAGGLIQRPLLPEIERVLTDPGVEFGLRWLVLQALKGSPLIADLSGLLLAMLRDRGVAYTNRYEAGERLAEIGFDADWPALVADLLAEDEEDGVRLASHFIDRMGYESFDDGLLLETTFAALRPADRTIGVYRGLERKLPVGRIDVLLDGLAVAIRRVNDRQEFSRESQITDLVYGLVARRLLAGPVEAARIWSWLEPFRSKAGLQRASREAVAQHFRSDDVLRRAVQRHVLLDFPGEKSVWERLWRLNERAAGLNTTDEDVIHHLQSLPDGDGRWRDFVQSVQHSPTHGSGVRAAAERFVQGDPEAQAWLAALATPRVPEWQREQEARQRKEAAARRRRWREHRANFLQNIDAMRAGSYGHIVNPAKAYLKLFADMGDEASDGPSRLDEWLGADLRDASLAGFEAFLFAEPPRPSATEIADSHAESRGWDAATIIVAALAERVRTGRGFEDLPDERIMAGYFEVRRTRVDDNAGIPELEGQLIAELRRRDAWELAERLYLEPQFSRRLEHVDGLYALVRDDQDADLATALATEWLSRFADMPLGPEAELIDRLTTSAEGRAALIGLLDGRLSDASLSDQRRRNWEAVGLILDFERTKASLEARGPIETDLLWHVRSRFPGKGGAGEPAILTAGQLAWMIGVFLPLHEWRERSGGVTSGDANAWDATNFIQALASRLGDDVSDDAIAALARIRDAATGGYAEWMRVVSAEQRRKRVETVWRAPELETIVSVVSDTPPTDPIQLQAVVLEELSRVQDQIRGSAVDWYKDFFDGDVPKVEEACRHTILKMLGVLPFEIQASPEGHLADNKRCDIICQLGTLMVPIEIKGQWHPDVWTAADRQLDLLYVNDWRAERGIYVVLWFGRGSKKPPGSTPKGIAPPQSAEELRAALTARSATTRSGRVEVVVLDVTRPN